MRDVMRALDAESGDDGVVLGDSLYGVARERNFPHRGGDVQAAASCTKSEPVHCEGDGDTSLLDYQRIDALHDELCQSPGSESIMKPRSVEVRPDCGFEKVASSASWRESSPSLESFSPFDREPINAGFAAQRTRGHFYQEWQSRGF